MCVKLALYLSTPAGLPPATADRTCREKRTAESREAAEKMDKNGLHKGQFLKKMLCSVQCKQLLGTQYGNNNRTIKQDSVQ